MDFMIFVIEFTSQFNELKVDVSFENRYSINDLRKLQFDITFNIRILRMLTDTLEMYE